MVEAKKELTDQQSLSGKPHKTVHEIIGMLKPGTIIRVGSIFAIIRKYQEGEDFYTNQMIFIVDINTGDNYSCYYNRMVEYFPNAVVKAGI